MNARQVCNDRKEISYKDCKALIFMAEPDKGCKCLYPDLKKDIEKWAELFGWKLVGDKF
jgi:hypothetical protein